MTVEIIILDYLQTNGYGGLYNDEGCGCGISYFMPCDNQLDDIRDCKPGYRVKNKDGNWITQSDPPEEVAALLKVPSTEVIFTNVGGFEVVQKGTDNDS